MKRIALVLAALTQTACSRSPEHFAPTPIPIMTAMTCDLKAVQEGALNPEYERGRPGFVLALTITNLNERAGTAQVVGNVGTSDVKFSRLPDQLHFLERTPAGNLALLTVYAPPEAGKPLPAAYSRHILVSPANVAISQYAGSCQPKI